MGEIPKSSALYIHRGMEADYDCDDCPFFIPDWKRCVLHGMEDLIEADDSCGLWLKGQPGSMGMVPLGLVTKGESGYTAKVNGAGCKRCIKFDPEKWDCSIVDKDSPGDDPRMIHPEACCCLWTERDLLK